MLIKSGIIASGSGSIGGMTLSHNRGGMYLRARAIPTDPASAYQQAVRTAFGNASARWATITQTQRDAWETYAAAVPVVNALGDPVYLSGQQMYVRCNAARVSAGLSAVDNGPTVYSADSLSPVSIAATETGLTLTVTFADSDGWVNEDDAALIVYGSRQQGPTINWFRGPYRLAGRIDGDGTTAPTSPDASLDNPFAMTTDNLVFFRVLSVRADGRISPSQSLGPVVIV